MVCFITTLQSFCCRVAKLPSNDGNSVKSKCFFGQTSILYSAIDNRTQYIALSAPEHCFHQNAKVSSTSGMTMKADRKRKFQSLNLKITTR